jgi:hypothetical protein
MFSLDKFYNILHDNLIAQVPTGQSCYFYPFGKYDHLITLDYNSVQMLESLFWMNRVSFFHCYFADQEPYYEYTIDILKKYSSRSAYLTGARHIKILANSEHSSLKDNFLKEQNYYNWYYFYHGFAALDWYRDFQYLTPDAFNHFDKVFICYNHLISKYRSYRLHLGSNLIEQDLIKYGHVSLFLKDEYGTWEDATEDTQSPLDNRARVTIYNTLKNIYEPLTIDTETPNGSMSAMVDIDQLTSALWHVVTETVYFQPKLHLTEKIFKPIVAKRPFILVAAPGNLTYLKSYGFRTFDRWIDESYDDETDHYIRIEKITAEISKLCAMDKSVLEQMHQEMQEILEYNFNHFYTTFKDMIVDELVDNFEHILCQINNGRQPGNHSRFHQRYELTPEYLEEVKKRLKQ